MPNITLEQALDAVSLESKAFWKPLTPSVIFVAPDNPQKRRDVEDEEVRTFYLSNTLTPQDLTEIVTGLRQLLDLAPRAAGERAERHRDPRYARQTGSCFQDYPRHRQGQAGSADSRAGVVGRPRPAAQPGNPAGTERHADIQSALLVASQQQQQYCTSSTTSSTTTSTSTSTASTPTIALNNLRNLSTADYSLTLPGAAATAILTDNNTQIIQDPQVRVSDGQKASLKIGQRVPVATGSFQAGVGVGVGGGAGVVNPLVNTQFQYIDVGVNIDVTPRVHPDGDVSMKLTVDVSSIAGRKQHRRHPAAGDQPAQNRARYPPERRRSERTGRADRARSHEEPERHSGNLARFRSCNTSRRTSAKK